MIGKLLNIKTKRQCFIFNTYSGCAITQAKVLGVGSDSCPASVTNCPGGEVLSSLPFLNDDICEAVNRRVSNVTPAFYGGKYASYHSAVTSLPTGQYTACITTTTTSTNHYPIGTNVFYHVAIAR